MKTDKIYLVGFMGAGKSTLARALGARLSWRVADVDELIEARERLSIPEIFRQKGEPYFRAVEREVVRSLLPVRYTVVATGGGTFADPVNRRAILDDGVAIWLALPFDEIVSRIPADGRRPLAADRVGLQQLFASRTLAYREAHVTLDATRPVEEQVERVLHTLGW